MSRAAWLIFAVVLLLLLEGGAVVDRVVNGARVGPRTVVRDDGLVDGDPLELATQAGLDLETYALARCLASEHGLAADAYLTAVGWAVRNKAAERGVRISRLLTDGAGTTGDGYFGEQKAAAGTKYASTRVDPDERHVRVAATVTASAVDPTGGATHFFSPRAQDALAARAETDPDYAKYAGHDAAYIEARWSAPGGLYAEGADMVVPPGVDPRVLALFRRRA